MISLVDELLPHMFIRKMVISYVQDERLMPDFNMFIAPLEVNKEILSKMPSVRIIVGTEDTLYSG
jgi:hypothetical protein